MTGETPGMTENTLDMTEDTRHDNLNRCLDSLRSLDMTEDTLDMTGETPGMTEDTRHDT